MKTLLQIFGGTVRDLRRQKGLSQEALAELCDLHRTYIGGIEGGKRNVGILNILAIANALDVPAASLFREYSRETVAELLEDGDAQPLR
jgi:transcriptional regulator with XRE-family HTH domain